MWPRRPGAVDRRGGRGQRDASRDETELRPCSPGAADALRPGQAMCPSVELTGQKRCADEHADQQRQHEQQRRASGLGVS